MRLKLGRPDLGRYADRFDVPEARGDLAVTFLGVATLLLDDGESAVLNDGYSPGPSLPTVFRRSLSPVPRRIDATLNRTGSGLVVRTLEAVAPVHPHIDH